MATRRTSIGNGTIHFGVLGTLSVQQNGSPVYFNAPTLRNLLAVLLLRANKTANLEELCLAIWNGASPPGARKAIQVYIHRLRQILKDDELIRHTPNGYSLATSPEELDSLMFAGLVSAAHVSLRDGESKKAAEQLRQALDLWRGPAFEGISENPLVLDEARRLDEERLRAESEWIELELELGNHLDLIPRLTQLTELHPLREDLRGHLMLALYRAGRQTEAADNYLQGRKLLGEELGLEPGSALRQLHSAILRGSPELDLPKTEQIPVTVPRELPPGATSFTGRGAALSALDLLVSPAASTPIALIAGAGGVGKTATALQWAHSNKDHFPDGQLFVDLRGYAMGGHLRPIDALTSFLSSLGVAPQQIPVDQTAATALFRSRVSGRRMLFIVDNARSAADVRPLLPGSSSCLTVVTSRDRLTGLVALDGAVRVPLDVLTPHEAGELVVELFRHAGVSATPEVTAALAAACGYLPLALRIAVAHIADRPYDPVDDQVARLSEGNRLASLSVDGDDSAAVRNTFALSYEAVSAEARMTFRRLGLAACSTFTKESVAALTQLRQEHVGQLLDRLASTHLVIPLPDGRYGLHDLLREFAQETCEATDSADERETAVARLHDLYLERTQAAATLLYPGSTRMLLAPASNSRGFASIEAAKSWLAAEHINVVEIIRQSAYRTPSQVSWALADQMRGYFNLLRLGRSWFVSARAGLLAARRQGDVTAQAAMLHMLGHAYGAIGRNATATLRLEAASRLCELSGDLDRLASIHGNLGVLDGLAGWSARAAPKFDRALKLFRQTGNFGSEGIVLGNLAACHWHLGNLKVALGYALQAVKRQREHGLPAYNSLSNLGVIIHFLGDHHAGLDRLEEALHGVRELGHRATEASSLVYIGRILGELGHQDQAAASIATAIRIAREIDFTQPLVDGLVQVGLRVRMDGELDAACTILSEAVEIARRRETIYELIGALTELADAQLSNRNATAAIDLAAQALSHATERQFKLPQARVLVVMAKIGLAEGNETLACELAKEAVAIQRNTGYVIGEAEALSVLGLADPSFAFQHTAAAMAIYQRTGVRIPPPSIYVGE